MMDSSCNRTLYRRFDGLCANCTDICTGSDDKPDAKARKTCESFCEDFLKTSTAATSSGRGYNTTEQSKLSGGGIVAIVFGILLIIGIIGFFFYRKNQRKKSSHRKKMIKDKNGDNGESGDKLLNLSDHNCIQTPIPTNDRWDFSNSSTENHIGIGNIKENNIEGDGPPNGFSKPPSAGNGTAVGTSPIASEPAIAQFSTIAQPANIPPVGSRDHDIGCMKGAKDTPVVSNGSCTIPTTTAAADPLTEYGGEEPSSHDLSDISNDFKKATPSEGDDQISNATSVHSGVHALESSPQTEATSQETSVPDGVFKNIKESQSTKDESPSANDDDVEICTPESRSKENI